MQFPEGRRRACTKLEDLAKNQQRESVDSVDGRRDLYPGDIEVEKNKRNKRKGSGGGEASERDVSRFFTESLRPTFRRRRGGLSESMLRKDLEMFRVYFIDARLKDYNLI